QWYVRPNGERQAIIPRHFVSLTPAERPRRYGNYGVSAYRHGRSRCSGQAGSGHSLGAAAQLAGDLPVGVALGPIPAFVVGLLTAGQRQFDLDLAVGEVHRQRHQREVAVADLADQVVDLPAVQQQLAVAPRRVVGPGAVVVLGDVDVAQPDLAVVDGG